MRQGARKTVCLAFIGAALAVVVMLARGGEVWTSAMASVHQDEPDLSLTPLASGELGSLPKEPLRWVVREFRLPPGFRSPSLTHPRDVLYVLEGVTGLTQGGVTVSLGPGSGAYTTGVDHVHTSTGSVPARVLDFALYPASVPTPADSPIATLLYESEILQEMPDGPYTMALSLMATRSDVPVPTHIHPGPTLPYLLEGEIEHILGGVSTTRRAGDAWLEQPGVISAGRFSGSGAVRILVAQVLPHGDPPLTPVD